MFAANGPHGKGRYGERTNTSTVRFGILTPYKKSRAWARAEKMYLEFNGTVIVEEAVDLLSSE